MKHKSLTVILLTFWLLCLILNTKVQAQEKDSCSVSVEVNADMVSSFIWRGLMCDMKPNIQPNIALNINNFQAGLWGTSNFDNTYREVDSWLSYSYKSFTLTVNDYFWTPNFDSLKFFDWNDKTTGHSLEASLEWEGPEKFPIKLTAATFVYGSDKKLDKIDPVSLEPKYKNMYSSYFEVAYPFNVKNTEVNVFVGATPSESLYATEAGIVNLGFSAKKYIAMTEKFTLPVFGSLVVNPSAGTAYIVFGISL